MEEAESHEGLQESPEDAFRFLHLNRLGYDFCHSGAQELIDELARMVPKSKSKEMKGILSKLQRYYSDSEDIVSEICKYTQASYLEPYLSAERTAQLDAEVQEEFKLLVQNRDDGANDNGNISAAGKAGGEGRSNAMAQPVNSGENLPTSTTDNEKELTETRPAGQAGSFQMLSVDGSITKSSETITLVKQQMVPDSGDAVAVHDSGMLQLVELALQSEFKVISAGSFEKIRRVAVHFVAVMEPTASTRKAAAIRRTLRADKFRTTVLKISLSSTVKSTLKSLAKAGNEVVVEEPPEVTKAIVDAKKAIYHTEEFVLSKGKEKKDARDPTLKYDDAVSDTYLENFTKIGHDTRNLMTHSLHLGIVTDVCGFLTVTDLFMGLNADLTRAVHLAAAYQPDISFDPKTTKVLIFLEDVVFPATRSGTHQQDALDVAEDIKIALNSLPKGARRDKILEAYSWAESRTVSGSSEGAREEDDEEEDDDGTYCAGTETKFNDRRLSMICLFFNLALHEKIQRVMPVNLCGDRGYFRTMLRTAPTDTHKGMNFYNSNNLRSFFRHEGRYDESSRNVELFRHYAKAADLDKNPRTLLVKTQGQIDGLDCLVKAAKKSSLS